MQSVEDANRQVVVNTIRQAGYGPMMSTAEVAEFVGLTIGAVQKALIARRLRGVRLGGPRGRWRVPPEALADFVCGRTSWEVQPRVSS